MRGRAQGVLRVGIRTRRIRPRVIRLPAICLQVIRLPQGIRPRRADSRRSRLAGRVWTDLVREGPRPDGPAGPTSPERSAVEPSTSEPSTSEASTSEPGDTEPRTSEPGEDPGSTDNARSNEADRMGFSRTGTVRTNIDGPGDGRADRSRRRKDGAHPEPSGVQAGLAAARRVRGRRARAPGMKPFARPFRRCSRRRRCHDA